MSIAEILRKNTVVIVMIPFVIGLHWGWGQIQKNDKLVAEHERKDLFEGLKGFLSVKLLGAKPEEKKS